MSQSLTNFLLVTCKANNKDETKIAIPLTLIDEDGLNVYNTFDPKKINNDKNIPIFTKVIKAFDYCNKKKNPVFERQVFLKYEWL